MMEYEVKKIHLWQKERDYKISAVLKDQSERHECKEMKVEKNSPWGYYKSYEKTSFVGNKK
jgi:hypothetical protein